jgi:hypothetical protein
MRTLLGLLLTVSAHCQILDLSNLELKNVKAANVPFQGSKALQLTGQSTGGAAESLAVLKNVTFRDGAIELEAAGSPAKSAIEGARGFIGVAFRVQPGATHYECIYLRPTNGRADDQIRRNHTTQYISFPDWPWEKLRKETPGVYESYVDMQPGAWTKMRIVVNGVNASLYVGGAPQPCLVVHDLKLGATTGGLALWIGPGTEGYFKNLRTGSTPGN